MKRSVFFLLSIGVVCCLLSCGTEYHIANSYLRQVQRPDASERIYVVLPTEVLHTGGSVEAVADGSKLTAAQRDSVSASLTKVLRQIDDSVFLAYFCRALQYTIGCTHIPVVVVLHEDSLPVADAQHFTLNVVQLEAEEYLQGYRSEFTTADAEESYTYDYDLRHFSANVWLKINAHDTVQTVYFKDAGVADTFEGELLPGEDGQAALHAHFSRMQVSDAYAAADALGATCGRLFVEHLLTEQVRRQKGSNLYYYYYSPSQNRLVDGVPATDAQADGFQVVVP